MPRVLTFLLVLLSLPLHAFEPVPPPGRTVGVPVREPAPSYHVEVASDGDGFFLATRDDRYGNSDVLGYRYDESGEPIDADAFPVAATWRGDDISARPIWNGSEYVVFANSEHIGTWRQRVRRDATVLSGGDPVAYGVAGAAWNGSRYAGITFPSGEVRLRFFDAALQPAGDVLIDTAEPGLSWAAIGTDGSQFLAAWGSGRSLFAQVFDERGNATSPRLTLATVPEQSPRVVDPREIPSFHPAIVWNGNAYAIAWSDFTDLEIAFLTPAGAETSRSKIPGAIYPGSIDIAWDGVTHLVTWTRFPTDDVRATFVSASGTVLETIDLPAISLVTSVASNGSVFFIATWRERFVVRSTGNDRVSGPKPLTVAFGRQVNPAITASTSNLFVAWHEAGGIFASRLSVRGEPLDGRGLRLGSSQIAPPVAVATAGDTHIVLWPQRFARVTTDGEILDPEGGTATEGTHVTSNGTSFLVAGSRGRPPLLIENELTLTIVPARGPAQATIPLAPAVYSDTRLHALVRFGEAYALVWTNYLDPPCLGSRCPPRRAETRVSRIADDGTLIRSAAIAAHGGAVSAAASDDVLLVAFFANQSVTTIPVAQDLTPGPATVPYRGGMGEPRLTRTSRGFALAFTTAVSWDEPRPNLLTLDASGNPVGPVTTLEERGISSDLVYAFGATWMTVVRWWHPLPESHPGSVTRAYVEDIRVRNRAVTH